MIEDRESAVQPRLAGGKLLIGRRVESLGSVPSMRGDLALSAASQLRKRLFPGALMWRINQNAVDVEHYSRTHRTRPFSL